MRRSVILMAGAILLLDPSCNMPSGTSAIEMRGDWQFRQAPAGTWRPATVPGCVHTDLAAHGLIGDPFAGTNEERLQWIEGEDWEYRNSFVLDAEFLTRDSIELRFEGIDTYADVYLNDTLLISADNMFREWRAPCRAFLREGPNELRVYLHSPVKEVLERWNALGYELPGGPRVLTRKAAYHYGWDWAPRFVTCGLWRPVYLVAWDRARIADLQIYQRGISEEAAELTARFEIESIDSERVVCSISDGTHDLGNIETDLAPGMNAVTLDFSIPKPRLWWTNGLGDPHLYTLSGVIAAGARRIDRLERRVGIRTIELVQEQDGTGKTFYFRLNGVPLFLKGANYVPRDSFLPRVTKERYVSLIDDAAVAGMNMLRVWGGGVYENDVFYDLCDERGMLVWQDFMFACAMYPGDETFLKNVEREATENVKRLRNHPCVALWCGNNEIDEGWDHWGWQRAYGYSPADSARIWKDYEKLFHELLPAVVDEYDSGRSYWPSSPSYGRADPRNLTEGDSHYWGVWHDGEPFEVFAAKVPRFMTEFGFQSFPSFGTMMHFARPEDWRIDSDVMLAHQKNPRGNDIIRAYMERLYRVPKDFRAFAYVSQLLQAEGMKVGIEAHRRAKPYCMGTLFWQLNDCWPAASWSSIDYDGNPKALYYYARNAFNDVLVSPVVEYDTVRVYVVSDRLEPVSALLELQLVDFSGDVLWASELRLEIPANSSRAYFDAAVAELLRGAERTSIVLSATVRRRDETLSSNLLYFVPPKELDLPRPNLSAPVLREVGSDAAGGYSITVSTNVLAKNVYLSVPGHEGFFTDNFFDMLPGAGVSVRFITNERIDDFGARFRIMTLADTY